jgi:tetratricopeptide (TPR) repeat protein
VRASSRVEIDRQKLPAAVRAAHDKSARDAAVVERDLTRTRQLPDAVVIMFLPTLQHIDGLKPIVRSIKRETSPVRREQIQLHFCPSNLPDLDDQENILKTLIARAKSELGYAKSAAEIQTFRSLDLLQQPIYAEANPTSRLVGQYKALLTSIESYNLTDRDGALSALNRILSELRDRSRTVETHNVSTIRTDAAFIAALYPDDVDIAWKLAELANTITSPEDELEALNVVIRSAPDRGRALLRRANVLATLGNRSKAIADLRQLLLTETADYLNVQAAVELFRVLEGDALRDVIEAAIRNARLDRVVRCYLLLCLLDRRDAASRVIELANEISQGAAEPDRAARRQVAYRSCSLWLVMRERPGSGSFANNGCRAW